MTHEEIELHRAERDGELPSMSGATPNSSANFGNDEVAAKPLSFQYCCFVSYPHGQDNVLVPFVNDLVEGLKKEIGAQSRKKVFIDYERLKGGNLHDKEIGPGLCKSACMVLVYTPLYFDTEHTYCARELKAMQDLEDERLRLMDDRGKGLIIPLILRGEKRFPAALSNRRIHYIFTDIEFNNPSETISQKYAKEIKDIADYILDRCEALDEVASHLVHNCNDYCLPTDEDARKFVEEVLGKKITKVPVNFVGRS